MRVARAAASAAGPGSSGSFERHYDLDGISLAVYGDEPALLPVLDLLLGAYATQAREPAPALSLSIERLRTAYPARAVPAGAVPRFHFPPLVGFSTPSGGWHLACDVGALDVDPEAGAMRGHVRAGASLAVLSRFAGLTIWVALLECLRARGRFGLHAAALVDPAGRPLILCGTKGAGKSTMTLGLLEAGFTVLTDDTLFVERDPEGHLRLLAYAKRFHVCDDLLERRPDLAPLARAPAPFEPRGKKWLALDEQHAGRIARTSGPPAQILFPRLTHAPGSRREALAPRATLVELLAHSAFVLVRPEVAPAHLALLTALVDGAEGARLHVGRDVLSDPLRYLSLVSPDGRDRNPTWTPKTSSASAWS